VTREQYRKLLPLVNNKDMMDVLELYTDVRIDTLRDLLETTQDQYQIRGIQSSIKELRRFSTLRDEVLKGAE